MDFYNDSESEADSGRGSNWSELSDLSNDIDVQPPAPAPGVNGNGPQQLALLCNNRIYNLVPEFDYSDLGDELEKCRLTIDLIDDQEDVQGHVPEPSNPNPDPNPNLDPELEPIVINEYMEEPTEAINNEYIEQPTLDTEPPESIRMVKPVYTVVYTICKCIYDSDNKLISSKVAHTEAYPTYDLSDAEDNAAYSDDSDVQFIETYDVATETNNNNLKRNYVEVDDDELQGLGQDQEEAEDQNPIKRAKFESYT